MIKVVMRKTDVIVPVFNEEEILEEFYQRITALNLQLNLIFIDNASTDNSLQIIKSFPDVTIVEHSTNEGYGSSLIDGMECGSCENIVIIDADCEYPPEVLPALIKALEYHDLVYTSRMLDRKSAADANMPFLKMLGNKIISASFNVLFRQHTSDLYTGCKGFKRHCIEGMTFKQKGFEHVLEFACLLSQRGYQIADIPINYAPRHTGSSKMSHFAETIKFLFLLLYFSTMGKNQTKQ